MIYQLFHFTWRWAIWRCAICLCAVAFAQRRAISSEPEQPRIAAVVTEYRHNSHADVIVSRMLLTDTLDGKGEIRC